MQTISLDDRTVPAEESPLNFRPQSDGNSARRRLRVPTTFSSLGIRNYRLYYIGQLISIAGTWMQTVAQAYLVLRLTKSGTDLGLVTAARTLPMLLFGPWGGLLVDRIDRLRVLYFTNTSSAVLAGILAGVVASGDITMWMLYLLAAGLGLLQVVDNPARQVILNDLVPVKEVPNAVSLNSVMINSGRILGPAVAGIIIAAFGLATCFALNAASFLVVLISLALIRREELFAPKPAVRQKGQIRAGVAYVRSEPELLLPLLLLLVAGMLTWEFQISIPLIAQDAFHKGAAVYGAMFAAMGAGAVVGGLVTASRKTPTNKGLAMSAIGWGAATFLAGCAPTVALEYGALVLTGYGGVAFNAIAKTKLQMAATPSMRGRVMAIWAVAWVGSTPIGGPIVGFFGQHFGARWSLYIGGVPLLVAGLIALPILVRLDRSITTGAAAITVRDHSPKSGATVNGARANGLVPQPVIPDDSGAGEQVDPAPPAPLR